MDATAAHSAKVVAKTTGDELSYGLRFLRNHGWKLALWFFFLLLPLWGFAAMVGELHEKEIFQFDMPLLVGLHEMATPGIDRFFVLVSKLGYLWGVLPFDAVFLLWLAIRRRFRDGLFFGLAVIGSAILNVTAKNYFMRARPALWLSITPETTYSFPSGHAMASATLGTALVMLCWRTRGRWPITIGAIVFVVLVGMSRVYLGVHYPSDILTGWTAAIAWVVALRELVVREAPVPQAKTAATSDDTISKTEG